MTLSVHFYTILADTLESTEIYTQVSLRKLRAVFLTTHPGATLEGKPPPEAEDEEFGEEENT
ncbi:MAG: hypothetical protein COZ70_05305 [Deltaproteobacteria bacterium CG_4_8_14_3_um_filter_51_11]|nr:MAG: hypothetical protein COZ70_05305 [Deltaproteobacteria bacterium CG_4_8_14_3_um_filter_51_11]